MYLNINKSVLFDGGKHFINYIHKPVWDPPRFLPNTYRGPFPTEVKRPGREADHSPLSNAEIKNGGAIPQVPHASPLRRA
jgi:hypothetical protein